MWSRLWANALLLKRPQYFPTHTYEGRLNTPLRGTWDLDGGLAYVRFPDGSSERLNAHYSVANTASPYFLRVNLAEGWHDLERLPGEPTRWRWTKGDATLRLENPQIRPLRIVWHFNARSEVDRDLQLWLNGKRVRTVQIGRQQKIVRVPEMVIPPGVNVVELKSAVPPTYLPGDARPLGFAAFGIEIEVKADVAPVED